MKSSDDSDQYDIFDDDFAAKTPIAGPIKQKKAPFFDTANPGEEQPQPAPESPTEESSDARVQRQPAEAEEQEKSTQQQ